MCLGTRGDLSSLFTPTFSLRFMVCGFFFFILPGSLSLVLYTLIPGRGSLFFSRDLLLSVFWLTVMCFLHVGPPPNLMKAMLATLT